MSGTHTIPKYLVLATMLGAFAVPACGGDAAKKTDAKVEAKKPEEKKPAAMAFKKLDKVPLEIEVPADAAVMDASVDAPAATVSSGEMTINIATVTEAYPKDFAAAKTSIEGEANKFKQFTKQAEIEGGWHLEYELTSMTDQAPLYGVEIRKTFDGKGYQCGRNDRSAAVRDAVAKACLTLKKAG